jgi:hypothetical protein
MTKRRLRPWVKYTLVAILSAIVSIAIYQLFTLETTKTTPARTYTCKGGIIQVCTGSKEVADYLGV